MLPELSKLQLVSDLQGPLDYHRTPNHHIWTLLSLPAQHICQTPYERRTFHTDIRPSPLTMLMHGADNTHHCWEYQIADSIGNTGGEVITYFEESAYTHLHEGSDLGDFWPEYQAGLEEHIESSTSLVRNSTVPIEFKYKMYEMIDTYPCPDQCDDEMKVYDMKATNLAYGEGYHKKFGDHCFPLEIQYHSIDGRPACPACGQGQVEEDEDEANKDDEGS
jgi:hypothetical protein